VNSLDQPLRDAFLEVVNTAIHFEYASRPVGSANLPEVVATAMWTNVDDIVLPRHCFKVLEKAQKSNDLCYVIGERGTGKSTALGYVLRKSDAAMIADLDSVTDPARPTNTILHVNGNELISQFKANLDRQILTRTVVDEINRKFMSSDSDHLILDLSESWRLHATNHAPDFANFRLGMSEEYDFKLASYDDLKFMKDFSAQVRKDWNTAWRRFNNRPSEEKFPLFVDMMAAMGHRLVIHLDNVDPLIDRDRAVALDAVTSVVDLAGSAHYKVNVTIAVRHEHFAWLQKSLDHRQHQSVKTAPLIANTDPKEAERDIREVYNIFLRRVAVLREARVRKAIASQLGLPDEVDLRVVDQYLEALQRRAEWVLQAFFFRQSSSQGTHDLGLSPLFSYWHNGSIRGMARSIHALLEEYVTEQEVQRGDRLELSERQARTVFFRHMLTFGVAETLQGETPLPPHSSTTLLIPREIATDSGPQFFLPLRVLHYLRARERRKHGAQVPLSTLHMDLRNVIGVEAHDIDPVVDELCERSGYELGLVRIHRRSAGDERTVSLLPAGTALVDRLLLTCESLFWTACSHDSSREVVARKLKVSSHDLSRYYDDESVRASAAMVFVGDYLLPHFKREHAYLDLSHGYTDDDVKYLGRYVHAFGFESNSWFLSKLRTRIAGFVQTGGTGVQLSQPALTAQAAIRAAEARLNTISAQFTARS
jgi:Cdc6-like AAA superfamily ATPase